MEINATDLQLKSKPILVKSDLLIENHNNNLELPHLNEILRRLTKL